MITELTKNKSISPKKEKKIKKKILPENIVFITVEYLKKLKEWKMFTQFKWWAISKGFEAVRKENKKNKADEYIYIGWEKI